MRPNSYKREETSNSDTNTQSSNKSSGSSFLSRFAPIQNTSVKVQNDSQSKQAPSQNFNKSPKIGLRIEVPNNQGTLNKRLILKLNNNFSYFV